MSTMFRRRKVVTQREFDYEAPVRLSVRYGHWTRLESGGVRAVTLFVGITEVTSLTEGWDEHLDTMTSDRTAELVRRWLAAPAPPARRIVSGGSDA